jgi:Peptidase M50B-like
VDAGEGRLGREVGTHLKTPPRPLLLPLGIATAALVLWDTFVVYPFRLFVVFLHEISHGLAAVLTGGAIESIGLSFDEGGVCRTRGGWPFLILNAGYLGSLLWGALFLVLGERRTRARSVIAAIGVFTLAVTLIYVRTLFGFGYGLATGLALLAVASRLRPAVSEVLLAAIGATSALYAVWDVASDVLLRHSGESDAAALAQLTGLPAGVWGVVWIALSLAVLAWVIRRLL